jgi:hypothetical protein
MTYAAAPGGGLAAGHPGRERPLMDSTIASSGVCRTFEQRQGAHGCREPGHADAGVGSGTGSSAR